MTVTPTTRWVVLAALALLVCGSGAALLYRLASGGSSDGSASTVEGSGVSATQARRLAPFHSIELAGGNNVVIHVGGHQSVVVKADRNLLSRVTTTVRSSELVIANTPGTLTTKSPMSVDVTIPALRAVTLSGSGNIVVSGVQGEDLTVSLPGSGTLTATGTATRVGVTIDGSGTALFTGLVADDVTADVAGSGSIFVTATRSLDASVSGSGAILYTGSPQSVTKHVTGSGAITGS